MKGLWKYVDRSTEPPSEDANADVIADSYQCTSVISSYIMFHTCRHLESSHKSLSTSYISQQGTAQDKRDERGMLDGVTPERDEGID